MKDRRVSVDFRGFIVGRGVLDLVVESKVILELKVAKQIHPVFVSQVVHYLAAENLRLGIVVDFGSLNGLQYKRVVL